MSKGRVFVVESVKGHDFPGLLEKAFVVATDSIEGLGEKLSEMTGTDVSILQIDCLDQDNHPGNAQISCDGLSTYYANIKACCLYD